MVNSYQFICTVCVQYENWRTFFSADVNECALGEDNCHESATCSDVVGGEDSFTCTCNTGYTGDGVSCVGEYCCIL